MLRFVAPLCLAVLTALTPLSGLAQTGPAPEAASGAPPEAPLDWTVVRFTEEPTLIATVRFDNGVGLVARCMDETFDVIINGLPPVSRRALTRQIGLQVGDEDVESITAWTTGSDRTTAFSRIPARIARQLAKGGALQIVVPPERGSGPRTRYVMDLDPSSTAIERILAACDRPLVDPRDDQAQGDARDGLPNQITWARQPRINFPSPVGDRMALRGYVTLSCVVQAEGRLDDCQIESEHPTGYNLGKAVEAGMRTARVRQSDEGRAAGQRFEGEMIIFTVVFSVV